RNWSESCAQVVPKILTWFNLAPVNAITLEFATMNKNEILTDLSESEMTRFGKGEFAQQSFPQKVFSAIWAVESEVNNGGFSQLTSASAPSPLHFLPDYPAGERDSVGCGRFSR